jgi:hypothetical protein
MRRAFLVCIGLVTLGVGCSFALDFGGYSAHVDDAQCRGAPPTQPSGATAGKDVDGLVAAFSFMSLEGKDRNGAPLVLGFNLDGYCACPDTRTCKPGVFSFGSDGGSTTAQCDDNTASQTLVNNIRTFQPAFSDVGFNEALRQGVFSQLLRLRSYNGLPDDPDVFVDFINGLALAGDGGAPTFKGNDTWLQEPTTNQVPRYTGNGWVSGGTLVAKFVPHFPGEEVLRMVWSLPPPGGGPSQHIPIALSRVLITAKVSVTGGRLTLSEGRLSGELTSRNGLQIGRAFNACSGTAFEKTRVLFCGAADLPDKNGICDSLSFSFAFEAAPANVNGETPLPSLDPCDGGTIPPSCASP